MNRPLKASLLHSSPHYSLRSLTSLHIVKKNAQGT